MLRSQRSGGAYNPLAPKSRERKGIAGLRLPTAATTSAVRLVKNALLLYLRLQYTLDQVLPEPMKLSLVLGHKPR